MSYFAEMYCYGRSFSHIGITGIRNCCGVIYVGSGRGYAVHIPYHDKDDAMAAADTFARYVRNNENAVGPNGRLFGFFNGKNWNVPTRESATSISGEELMAVIKKKLGSWEGAPPTTMYRLMKFLGNDSGGFGADAAVIMIERVHVSGQRPDGCVKLYKPENQIVYEHYGSPPDGKYKAQGRLDLHRSPSGMGQAAGWYPLNGFTCQVTDI